MKRILFMHQVSSIGGGSYCLLNILKSVDKNLVEPIACLVADGPLCDEIKKLGIKVVFFPQMTAIPYNESIWKLSSIKAYKNIDNSISVFKEVLMKHRIEVVYLNNMMIYRYLQPAKECGCQTILHCREHWPLDQHTTQLLWARNAVYKYADELIAINHYSASIFPKKKATIVYDWIDMDSRYTEYPLQSVFNGESYGLHIYLFTGGFSSIKGTKEVFLTFSKNCRNTNDRLLVLGLPPQKPAGYKHIIKLILKYLHVREYYTLDVIDVLNTDKRIVCIPPTYNITHIIQQSYCVLSYFTIPHANLALAESIICGTPVIAAKTEESLEYSKNGELAILFDFHSIKDFSMKLQSFEDFREKLVDRLQNESVEIKALFDKNKNIKKLNSVFQNLD